MKMENVIKNALAITTLCALLAGTGIIMNSNAKAETATETIYLEVPNETECVYPICDVVETYETELDITFLVCKMPNGELHAYKIEDAPEGKIELVCFRTYNQDDYTTYEVVGVR